MRLARSINRLGVHAVLIAVLSTVTQAFMTSSSTSSCRTNASPTTLSSTTSPVDARYYSTAPPSPSSPSTNGSGGGPITLTRYLDQAVKEHPEELGDLESLLLAVQMACKTISHLVNRAGLAFGPAAAARTAKDDDLSDGRFYSMKRLDQLSTLVLSNALKLTGKCQVVAPTVVRAHEESPAQHQPGVLIAKSLNDKKHSSNYVACLDPLDGSGNADASICTGTVFGVFEQEESPQQTATNDNDNDDDTVVQAVLQPAKNMRAAGYCLYSSATVLVFSLGDDSVQGFTLDPQLNEFVLTHANLTIPARGSVYSCNEGNSEAGWDENWQHYLRDIKTGQGQSGQRYAHRYVGSMVGDIHRTLLYGGIFAYPSDQQTHPHGNLQLLYKTAPMAFIVHHAGGKAIDGRTGSLLNVKPERIHQKSPCFMGSPLDVAELETYILREEGAK